MPVTVPPAGGIVSERPKARAKLARVPGIFAGLCASGLQARPKASCWSRAVLDTGPGQCWTLAPGSSSRGARFSRTRRICAEQALCRLRSITPGTMLLSPSNTPLNFARMLRLGRVSSASSLLRSLPEWHGGTGTAATLKRGGPRSGRRLIVCAPPRGP